MAPVRKNLSREELVRRELLAALAGINVVVLFAVLIPAVLPLERTGGEQVPAPWIFAGVQWLLKYMPPVWAGVILPVAVAFFLLGFPYVAKKRAKAAETVLWTVLAVAALVTILGYLLI